MGGGLMQLVVKGSQDTYLTGNPQMTYFKSVYPILTLKNPSYRCFSMFHRFSKINLP